MAYSEGSSQYFAYKLEAVSGTEESGGGGVILRRVTASLPLVKAEVLSAEKRDDFQEVTVLHGNRQAPFTINGELFGGDYAAFIGAALRRDLSSISTITASCTIASGVLTRASGSFITDGLRVGHVVRLGAMTTSANLNRNLRVTAIASDGSTATLIALDGGAPIANDAGPNASASITIPGKVSYLPSTSHTARTFTIEKHDRATDTSQVSRGCKVGSLEIAVQPDQTPTITITGLGIDRRNVGTGAAPVLTTPTAAGFGPAMSSGIGYVRVNGIQRGAITALTLTLDVGINGIGVAFGNVSPDVFYGRAATISGTFSLLKTGNDVSDIFDQETEVSLEFYIAAPGAQPQAFTSVFLGRVKFNNVEEDDPDTAVTETVSFRAQKRLVGAGHELTVIMIQDSSAA